MLKFQKGLSKHIQVLIDVRKYLLLFAAASLAGCGVRPQGEQHRTPPVAVLAKPSPIKAKPSVVSVISEISLRREPGLTHEPKPEYLLTLRRDGTVAKINFMPKEWRGTFRATILRNNYNRLAQLVEASKFGNYESFYGTPADDASTVTVSVVKNGKRKKVEDLGRTWEKDDKEAPKSLKQIEEQIDLAVAKANWKKVSNDAPFPR